MVKDVSLLRKNTEHGTYKRQGRTTLAKDRPCVRTPFTDTSTDPTHGRRATFPASLPTPLVPVDRADKSDETSDEWALVDRGSDSNSPPLSQVHYSTHVRISVRVSILTHFFKVQANT